MALLYSWNTVASTANDHDSPLTEDWGEAMRQNDWHLRQTVYGDGAGGFKTAADGHTHNGTNSLEVQTGRGGLKTSIGNIIDTLNAGTGVNITLPDYCFFPYIHVENNAIRLTGHLTAPGGSSVGRLGLYNTGGSTYGYEFNHRYITASEGEQYAKFLDAGEVIAKASFEDAPPEWNDIWDAFADDNGYERVDIEKEEYDSIKMWNDV